MIFYLIKDTPLIKSLYASGNFLETDSKSFAGLPTDESLIVGDWLGALSKSGASRWEIIENNLHSL